MSSSFVMIRGLLLSLVLGLFAACEKKASTPVLKVAIWGNYLSPELQQKFTHETGIKLELTHYSSNEELLAKVQAGGSDLDVGVPSDYMVPVMAGLELLEKLDRASLPHFKNLDPKLLNPDFDPQNSYSIPYAWSTTGIAVHRGLFKGSIKTFKDLFENPELKGQISALDDMRELAAIALKMQKQSVNTTDPKSIRSAFEYLRKVKPQIKVFSSNAVDLLKNKEIKAGLVYSTDALLAQKADPQIEYFVPEEGSTQAVDNVVIFKKSRRKTEAHKFLDFLMTEEANLNTVETIRAGPVVVGIRAKLPESLRQHKALFPEPQFFKKLERLKDLGESNSLYESEWTEFKLL